ncbi:MAG: transglutaminase domain-containing protein [Candidatus Zhuqueibacterota bacterium]
MKKLTTVWAIFFFLLLIGNLWYFLTREWESSYYPASYATLYYPLDIPVLRNWDLIDRRTIQANISWNKNVEKWQISCDGATPEISEGRRSIIHLQKDEAVSHSYTLTPLPAGIGQDVSFSISFYSKEFYAERGMKRNDVYVIKPSIPCGDFKQYSVANWVDDYKYVGAEGLAKVDTILRDDVGIQGDETTFRKMEKLTRYLRIKLINARGVPKDDARWMNPLLLFEEMVSGDCKGWCTQHGQIYTFFANRAGIPTRLMLGALTQDNLFVYTGHTWAESYIAEQQRWAFVDLSHSNIYITDKNGLVLNTADLLHLNQHNAFDGVQARIYKDWEWTNLLVEAGQDTVVTVPFSECNGVTKSEFIGQAILKYRRPPFVEDVRYNYTGFVKDSAYLWGNLERYLFKPPLAYSLYPTEGRRTYIIRHLLFWSMLAAAILWGVTGIFSRRHGAERRR